MGYSFNDSHINDLIKQSLESDRSKKLLVVEPTTNATDELCRIKNKLNIENVDEKIIMENMGAKEFLNSKLSLDYIGSILPQDELPF